MAISPFRNGLGKAIGDKAPGAAAAALLFPLLISSQVPPQPAARLDPAVLTASLAHDAAPVDLTTTLSNTGTAPLAWRIGSIRDVSAETAPSVATGPVAAAKVYARDNLEHELANGEIIVGLKETSDAALRGAAPAAFLSGRAKVKRELARARRKARAGSPLRAGRKLFLLSVEDKSRAGMQKAIDDLRKDPSVAYAEPNYRVRLVAMPDDADFRLLYGMHNTGQSGGVADADIDAPEAWDTHTGDGNAVVGIVDTGIDYLHPDLAANMWVNPGEIPGNGVDDDGNGYVDDVHGYDFVNDDPDPMDDHFHGTHVAGTVAGVGDNGIGVTGVAWGAKLAALKFLNAGGSGSTSDAIDAIAYANAMNIPITNNSWGGGGFSQALKDVIDAAGERGFLFVAAAGNSSSDNDRFPSYPSTYDSPNILSVAATDHADGLARFSSFGATTVDLGAPGVDTYSCQPGGGYRYLSGTSMATPHVAGAAALLRSYNPQLGWMEIKAALLAGVDPVPSLSGRTLTGGRLNVATAIGAVNPPWITVAPKGPGTLAPGASQVLTARVDPARLTAGRHRSLVTVVTDDPARPDHVLEVIADVSGCRSLAVQADSLDFGSVWRTTTKRLTLTLRNACNDFTTVGGVESSSGAFAAAGALPLRVPPFGVAALDIAYAPDRAGEDSGILTLRSDAADHPVLEVRVRGLGVEPPVVSASPAAFELTLDPADQATRTLTVANTGGDVLTVDLRGAPKAGGAAARKPGADARIVPGQANPGKAYASAVPGSPSSRLPAPAAPLAPSLRPSASGLRVLYLTTIIPTGSEDQFTAGLRSLPNVASMEVLNGRSGTPNLDYLSDFDAVIVSANSPWANPVLLGNTLADYVDNGGAAALMVAAIASGGGYGLQGRITGPDYMPIEMAGAGNGGVAVDFERHPITAGIRSIECGLPTRAASVRGSGISLGRYPSGNLVGAVNPDRAVVALNIYPGNFYWAGDVVAMTGNTLDYLAGAASWLRIQPRNASIPPGGSVDFTLAISAEGQLAGDHELDVEIRHNAPAGENPLRVPVLLHVRPVSRLALAPGKHEFGGVMLGNRASAIVTLTNAGNRATTVSEVSAEGDFASALPVPFSVPAFSSRDVEILYAPRTEGDELGSLTFRSDAQDHPALRIALRGRGLPAPLAVLDPSRLSVSLAYDAPPRDLTGTLANAGRGVLHWQVTSVRDLSSPSATAGPGAVATARIYAEANYALPAVPGELIVGLKEGREDFAAPAALASAVKSQRVLGRARSPRSRAAAKAWKMPRKLLLVTLADASQAGVRDAIAGLRRDANVAYAEPNYRVKAIGMPNDPDFGLLYGLHNEGQTGGAPDADIDATEAWDTHTGDSAAVVGIIDTGIDWLHPDLAANIWTNPGEIPGNGADDDGNGFVDDVHGYDFLNEDGDPMDDNYHGTHVAGTVAGVGNNGIGIAGVAWKARLAGLKFLDAFGGGTTEDAIEAVAYANAMGIGITNNSWGGGGYSQALKDVIEAGGAMGHLFVAAAGNDFSDNDLYPAYPASFDSDNILSVAATDHGDKLAGFSNIGATTVDLGAPGVDVFSTAPQNGYQYLSGTSMATPHVAGAAALLKGYNPSLGYVELKSALMGSVDPLPDLAGVTVTGGRLNINSALAGVSPPWLTVSPRAPGILEPGATAAITATVNPAGLIAGEHRGLATLATDDPAHPTLSLEVVATVSGCKSLAAGTAALDFGSVWLGAARRLTVSLRNACNDFTTVSALESSHPAFAPVSSAPVVIPPFGTVSLEIAYTPDDLKADKGVLTLRSDAQDRPVLKVDLKGTGVKPPAIAVEPSAVALALDPSERKRVALKVANKGGAELSATLRLRLDRPAGATALAPEVTTAERKAGGRYGRHLRKTLSPVDLHPLVRGAATGLKVLYLTTLFQPDSVGDMFTQGLRGLPQVARLDVLDGSVSTPNADYLQAYDVVVVSADYPWADAEATGNVLADYVDAGGRVALLVASIASGGDYELLGRMGGPEYMPIVKAGGGYYGVAAEFADHPITRGLASLECSLPTAATAVEGDALALGRYDNGALLGAVHAAKPVVALNVFPGDYAWAGDLVLMMANTLDYLDDFTAWVKVDPAALRVPPGKSAEAGLLFDTERMEAGVYAATLTLEHNAPGTSGPVSVPINLTVKARNCLEASPSALDFGKVWTDRSGTAQVVLANPCNRPTRVKSLTISGKTFRTQAAAPLDIPAFSELPLSLIYTPDDLRADKGELAVQSDALDHPRLKIALAGTGVKPPSILVKPAALKVAMDPGAVSRHNVEIQNKGGDTLRLKVSAQAVEEAGAPSRGRTAGLKILYLHTVYMYDSVAGDEFTRAMRGLANVASVDLLDVTKQTPDLGYLLDYDIAVVATDYPLADPYLLGDVLADYVDAGGRTVLMANAFYELPPWGLDGRIATPEYLPLERRWVEYGGYGPALVDHPINAGVTDFYSYYHIASANVQGAGQPLGNYQSGFLTGAYHADKPVVALNVFPFDGYWGGDVPLLMGNTFDYLGNGVRWMKPSVRDLVIPPGKSRKLSVELNTAGMAAGEYPGRLAFEHNAPAVPSPLEVPVTLKVNPKRCLETLASLDFGKVWKGQSATHTIELTNRCNQPTTLGKISAADGAFTARAEQPVVAPFSSLLLEVAFSPMDLKSHKSVLKIESDAQDDCNLEVALSGKGIAPPSITATPGSFSESVKAGESISRTLTVANPGGDVLHVSIGVDGSSDGSGGDGGGDGGGDSSLPAPKRIKSRSAPASVPWSGRGLSLTSLKRIAGGPQAKAGGMKVLYLNTTLPDSGYEDTFAYGLRNLPQVSSLSLLNAGYQTPDLSYLLGFDAVVVASDYGFLDPAGLGDVLADYVDAGGRICLMVAAISNDEYSGLAGRIATARYLPMTREGLGFGGSAIEFEEHPINEGVTKLYSYYPTASTSVQGDGRPLGRFEGGSLIGAYSEGKAVVAVNVLPTDWGWYGDLMIMMGNVLEHLSARNRWLTVDAHTLEVPPGGRATVTVTFDGGHVEAGTHSGNLTLSHNAPGQGDVVIPATLSVEGRRSLAVSARELRFGSVLIGAGSEQGLILSNDGNLPETVAMTQIGSDAFTVLGATFPLELAAGERVHLQIGFFPSAHGEAAGTLTFAAEGLVPALQTELSGFGLRPAELSATTSPAPLRFSVAENGQANGTLDLANLGDEDLDYVLGLYAGMAGPPDSIPADPDSGSVDSTKKTAYGPEHHVQLRKGSPDTRVGKTVTLSQGGPDAFGHRWTDSRQAGGPAFAWTDISATGRLLESVSNCDDCSEEVGLSFAFPFYAASGYGSMFVGSNGYVTFGEPSDAFSNHPLPSASMPGNLVAALFHDLYPAGGEGIFFQDFGDRAVVQYQAVPDFQGTGTYDFQIVLHADGTVDLLYKSLTGVKNTATAGIQNAAADDGLGVVYNADYLGDSLAVRIRTFVTVPERIGTIAGTDHRSLPVSLDARGLAPGTHSAVLDIHSRGFAGPRRLQIPVELMVTPAPSRTAKE